MSSIFSVIRLNDAGLDKAEILQKLFEETMLHLEIIVKGDPHVEHEYGREMSIVRTKLQEASFFAKRAMALNPRNQREECKHGTSLDDECEACEE